MTCHPLSFLKSLIKGSWSISGMPIMPPQLQRRNGASCTAGRQDGRTVAERRSFPKPAIGAVYGQNLETIARNTMHFIDAR